ncbi:isoprenylcysteine carboxylmethyltransferase family protein [Lutimonas halocynthiae]|uniref:methyltransferase family protein n=1 Tax=Lutimonas halocynthiae TaxID=1446477 RepID=UPI0025B2C6C6|nr:isoprenylcysteine carboxylmethyltransferase family protein [Lutimonas halocynthiae]MDN3643561.1 isoprenylcysteine carboxylmethyltransferase family protein [Lutimonas halocynthiae]
MSSLSKLLVIIQFSCLLYLVLFTKNLGNGIFLIIQMIGLSLALWSVFVMGIGRFNIQPEVKKEARLITKGPYKVLRNPMYSGLILFFGATVFQTLDIVHISVFVILIIVLLYKIILEEKYLSQKFGSSYNEYKEKSYRLFPFIF